MTKPDITYSDDGIFVTFLPETPIGVEAWIEMSKHGTRFFSMHLPAILHQLRAAGYRVGKAKVKKSQMTDDELLRELGINE